MDQGKIGLRDRCIGIWDHWILGQRDLRTMESIDLRPLLDSVGPMLALLDPVGPCLPLLGPVCLCLPLLALFTTVRPCLPMLSTVVP